MRIITASERCSCPEHWSDTGIGEYLSPISNDYGSEYGEQLQFLNAWGEYYVDEMEKDTALAYTHNAAHFSNNNDSVCGRRRYVSGCR